MAAGRNEDVVRLVERYHGEHIQVDSFVLKVI